MKLKKDLKMDFETSFLSGLLELQYGLDVKEKLKPIAERIEWANGWPEDKKAFWNAEAFMWGHKIDKEKRELIIEELKSLKGKNLDLGCGAYSYIDSVGFDLSEKMLNLNERCKEKIVGDLEDRLPFNDSSFDSVTAIFVFNYVINYGQLFSEILRVLNAGGLFMMVLYSGKLNEWQAQKEINKFSFNQWKFIIQKNGFEVQLYGKEGLWFFRGRIKS